MQVKSSDGATEAPGISPVSMIAATPPEPIGVFTASIIILVPTNGTNGEPTVPVSLLPSTLGAM